jgi:MFS transporter, PPP family, 3-phenylpropionic acid transporter
MHHYWQLASVYAVYFAVVGAMVPYWSLYLSARHFNAAEIGALLAIPTLTKIIVPNIWGYVADKSGHYKRVILLGALGALGSFAGIFVAEQFITIAIVMTLYSAFWNAILPQFEAVTLHALGAKAHNYSQIRLWGSVGFIVLVLGLGWVFDCISIDYLPVILSALMALLVGVCLSIPNQSIHKSHEDTRTLLATLMQPAVALFFIATLLYQMSHGIYYGFYSIYLHSHGYSASWIGALWTLGVAAEIVLFWRLPQYLPRLHLGRTAAICMLVAAVRWALLSRAADYWGLLVLLQLLHAITFGLFHASSVQFIRERFGAHMQGQGQALYGAIGYGLGGAAGLWICGVLWQQNSNWAFGFAVAAATAAALVQMLGLQCENTKKIK